MRGPRDESAQVAARLAIARLTHLERLEAEAIHILREAVAGSSDAVLHIDSTWEIRSLLEFRDRVAARHGIRLIAHANDAGRAAGMNPFDHGDRYTTVMLTEPVPPLGPPAAATRTVGSVQPPAAAVRDRAGLPDLELDRD
jgi:hypothetical protein